MNTALNLSAAPHARDRWTTPFIMRMVTLSLLPATIVGIAVHGWNAFGIVALAIVSAVATEWLFCKACKKPSTIWDGSAVVTGLLLALSLGPDTPLYIPVIGSVFAIAVCKCCFGGLGKNFINPALAARCFLLISFGSAMAIRQPLLDGTTGATPVALLKSGEAVNITEMFLGTSYGVIGGSILALVVGGLLLWSLDIIHGQICFSVLIGFTLIIGCFGGKGFEPGFLLAHLCGGGVVMGAFFMATDYVTSPVSRLGQFIYGCLIGVLGGVFRLWGKADDSFSYAIIIGNICTPLIDTYIVQKPFAYRRLGRTRKNSKEPFRIPKPVIALTLIAAIAGVALSGVHSVTKGPIEEQKLQNERAAYTEVCPDAVTFDTVEAAEKRIAEMAGESTRVNQAFEAKDAEGNVVGYVLNVSSKGFGGTVALAMGLTPDGKIIKMSFTEMNETPGYGRNAVDDPTYLPQFIGKSGTLTASQSSSLAENEVTYVSGATRTTNAVMAAVNAGMEFYETVLKGGN